MSVRFVKVVCALLLLLAVCMPITAGGQGERRAGAQIEFWTPFVGPDGVNMDAMVAAYNATNPAIQVVHMPIREQDFYPQLPSIVSSGRNVPDLTVVHVDRLGNFVDNNMLMPLDSYLASRDDFSASDYVPSAFNAGEMNGRRYALPLDVHSFVLYYNKDLLQKYGPGVMDDGLVTFDEVIQVGDAARADGITSMGITWMRVKFLGWYAQLGGQLGDASGQPAFNNSAAERVLDTVKSLHDRGYTNVDGDDPGQMFRSGNLVFWPEGIWMMNSLAEIPDLNWGMTHSIVFDTDSVKNWTSSHQFVLLDNPNMTDERAQAVMDFIAWVGENSIEWARAGQVPAHFSILDNPEFASLPQAFLLKDSDSLSINEYKHYGYAVEALDKIVWEVPFGRVETKAGLQQAVREVADRIRASQ